MRKINCGSIRVDAWFNSIKLFWGFALACAFAVPAIAQTQTSAVIDDTNSFQIVERGSNYRVHERIERKVDTDGNIREIKHSYTELATGLCYRDPLSGQWVDSDPEIIVQANGTGLAHKFQSSILFQPNINTAGAIDLTTPTGNHLRSHVIAICLYDWKTEQSVQIAGLQDSVGTIFGKNQVIYENALAGDGTSADVRYTFRKSGMSQDVVLHQLISPADLQLSEDNLEIEIWTEFLDFPQLTKHTVADRITGLANDTILDFGDLQIGQGTAFSVGDENQRRRGTPVKKEWITINGRIFLIESVPYKSVRAELEKLAAQADARSNSRPASHAAKLIKGRIAPPVLEAKAEIPKKLKVASVTPKQEGFVLDYETFTGGETCVLKGDTTYYVSGQVDVEASLTIEGGSVIKYSRDGCINVYGSIDCQTDAYRPAIFTAMDDDSVGETLFGISTGQPSGFYSDTALNFGGAILNDLRFSFMSPAICPQDVFSATNLQFIHCEYPIYTVGLPIKIQNSLFSDFDSLIEGTDPDYCFPDIELINVTAHNGNSILDNVGAIAGKATNCIFAEIASITTGNGIMVGRFNGFYPNTSPQFGTDKFPVDTPPFQTQGGGNYYLAVNLDGSDASGFRNQGTTEIDADLLDELKEKTTYAPTEVTENITSDAVWPPQVARDIEFPDLGYHYDPLDYTIGSISLSANLVLTNGVAVGLNGAITPLNGGNIYSGGQAKGMNHVVSSPNVQEAGTGATAFLLLNSGSDYYRDFRFRFTDFSVGQGSMGGIIASGTGMAPFRNISVQDCSISDGSFYGNIYNGVVNVGFTNNLLVRCNINFSDFSSYGYYNTFNFYNQLFKGGSLTLSCYSAIVKDNLFDGSTQSAPANASNNGFTVGTSHSPAGPNDKTDLEPDYESGPLGDYYYPAAGGLTSLASVRDVGSRSAADAGLAYFTTQTSQMREGTSSGDTVDIGFHYAADSNGDGLADYWLVQYGLDPDVAIADPDDPNDPLAPAGDPDGDGLSNLQEYHFGASPVRPDNPAHLVDLTAAQITLVHYSALPDKAYDIYYRPDLSTLWRRISCGASGQTEFTVANPDPSSQTAGDYIFLDADDDDHDDMPNGYEYWFPTVSGGYTDPNNWDSDDDGLRDGWEVAYGLDPTVITGNEGNGGNPDTDVYSNKQEHDLYTFGDASYDPRKTYGSSDNRPVVTISTATPNPSGTVASFTITRWIGDGGSLSSPLTVYYAVGGDLAYGSGNDYTLNPTPTEFPRIYSAQILANTPSVTVTVTLNATPQTLKTLLVALTPYSVSPSSQVQNPDDWEYVVDWNYNRLTIDFGGTTVTLPDWIASTASHTWAPSLGGGVWHQERSVLTRIADANVVSEYPQPVLIGLRSDRAGHGYRFDIRNLTDANGYTFNAHGFSDHWIQPLWTDGPNDPCSQQEVMDTFPKNTRFMMSMPVPDPNRFVYLPSYPNPDPSNSHGHGFPWQVADYYAAYLQYLLAPATMTDTELAAVIPDNPNDSNPDHLSYDFFQSSGFTRDTTHDASLKYNWGNLRARRGHRDPYPISAVILGIEAWDSAQEAYNSADDASGHPEQDYADRIEAFRQAIRSRGTEIRDNGNNLIRPANPLAAIPLGLQAPDTGGAPMKWYIDHGDGHTWFDIVGNRLYRPLENPPINNLQYYSYIDVMHHYRNFGFNGKEDLADWKYFKRFYPAALNNSGNTSQGWQEWWKTTSQWSHFPGSPPYQYSTDFRRWLWIFDDVKTFLATLTSSGDEPKRWKIGCAEHGLEGISGCYNGTALDNDMGAGIHWALYLAELMHYNAAYDISWVLCEQGHSHAQIQSTTDSSGAGRITRTPGHYAYKMAQQFYGYDYHELDQSTLETAFPGSNGNQPYPYTTGTVPASSGGGEGTPYLSSDLVIRAFRNRADGHYHLFVINKHPSNSYTIPGWSNWTVVRWEQIHASSMDASNPSCLPCDNTTPATAPDIIYQVDLSPQQPLTVSSISINHIELRP